MKQEGRILRYTAFSTLLGWCGVAGGKQGIREIIIAMPSKEAIKRYFKRKGAEVIRDDLLFLGIRKDLTEYTHGKMVEFQHPLDFSLCTPFQEKVYQTARSIPCGSVWTYGLVAKKAGTPRAVRAVGTALARNPFPIIIPCHRVVPKRGGVGNYTGPGGERLKKRLLALEGALIG